MLTEQMSRRSVTCSRWLSGVYLRVSEAYDGMVLSVAYPRPRNVKPLKSKVPNANMVRL